MLSGNNCKYYKPILGRSKSSYSVLFVSDLHIGNYYSVCTEEPYIASGDTYYKPNVFQQNLLEHWDSLNDRVSKKPIMLTVNGEFIDGNNKKSLGTGLWSTDLNDQANDAIKLVKRLKYENITATKGSPYHSKTDSINIDEMIARQLNAYSYSGLCNSRNIKNNIIQESPTTIKYYLYYRILDYVFNIVHKVGYSKIATYRPTPLSRIMMIGEFEKDKLFNKDDFNNVTTFYIRSHTHNNLDVGFNHSRGFVTPCWKIMDEFLTMDGISATDIGALELIIDPNEYTWKYHLIPSRLKPKIKIPNFTPKLKSKTKLNNMIKF